MPISVNSIPTFSTILVLSAALRVGLIIYSEWHDARPGTVVKYTDIDYRVFSDATAFLLRPSAANNNIAKGPLAPPWIGECVSALTQFLS
jgi:phosphatidylinositol glycan class M